ncbi:hypothetical protein Acr_00g0055650 [Actinidia rufa]|uniref:Uncharacterized protein n=1 Tax=Actinidia rufa TaxID=165716 RepID=A0A7J0DNZ2_9ERIC|nr:hypothetical protein Acr_00g0055650 [Actinidia rufa]
MDCLNQFGDISGLRINANKSNVFMAGINSTDMAEIKTITGFRMGKFPFCYLGIPMAATRLTIEQFRPLTAKISGYVSAWARATLSYAGRRQPFWEYNPTRQDSQMIRQLAQIRDKIVAEEGSCLAALNRLQLWIAQGNVNVKVKASYEFFRPKATRVHWTKVIWAEIKEWLGFFRVLTTLKATTKWIIKEGRGSGVPAVAKKLGFASTVYCVWKARNAKIFEGKASRNTDIVRDIKLQVFRGLHETFPNIRDL